MRGLLASWGLYGGICLRLDISFALAVSTNLVQESAFNTAVYAFCVCTCGCTCSIREYIIYTFRL